MNKSSAGLAVILLSSFLLEGCATTPSRFEWGGYESALYTYAKKPDRRADYQKALEVAVARGRTTDRVAPGLLAELGYVYLEDGDLEHAVPLFEEEMQRFPESRTFLTGVVARARAANAPASKSEVKS
jgi:hypothetical protein